MENKRISMKKRKNTLKSISKFLSFFNLSLETKDYYDLINELSFCGKLSILDDVNNVVGYVVRNNEEIFLSSLSNGKFLECIVTLKEKNDKTFEKFNYSINDNNLSLNGFFEFSRDKNNDAIFLEGVYHINEGVKELSRSKFSTYDCFVNITNPIDNEYINFSSKKKEMFKEDKLFHKNDNITFEAICNNDDIYFKMKGLLEEIKFSDEDKIIDNRYLYGGYNLNEKNNFDLVDEEIKNVYQEYDPTVFEFIEKNKNLLNYFGKNVFEKVFATILFRLGKQQRKDIFGIDDSYKNTYCKK